MEAQAAISQDTFDERLGLVEHQIESLAPKKVDDYPGAVGEAYMSLLIAFRHFRRLATEMPDTPKILSVDWQVDSRAQQVEIEFQERGGLMGKTEVLRHLHTSSATLNRLLEKTNFPRQVSPSGTRVYFEPDKVDLWMQANRKTFQMAKHGIL